MPALLTKRSRKGGRDRFGFLVLASRIRVLVAMPFDEADESPFVGLLQVEAA